jgi:arsenate reductase
MAAALFNAMVDPACARAISAGTEPDSRVQPEVVRVMREQGFDLERVRPQRLTAEVAQGAGWLITMGCGDRCPVVAGLRRNDWPVEDPLLRPIEEVRRIRDEVGARVREFARRQHWLRPGGDVSIERATPADMEAVFDLLRRSQLPTDGLAGHFSSALVARREGLVVGSAALEIRSDGALLRSVAVDPDVRGAGVGKRLCVAAIELGATHGVTALYLLTTTAERFFRRVGFVRITRTEVPPGVRGSVEFTSVCCASAAVMRRFIDFDGADAAHRA